MPVKFECKLSTEELKHLYLDEGLTIKQLCPIVGCKSDITMAKILKSRGIDTNSNKRRALSKRNDMSEEEYKDFLIKEYVEKRRSMTDIGIELGVSEIIISKYLSKYNLPKRTRGEQTTGKGNHKWNGGRRIKNNGYIEIYAPDHPKANKRKCVYEHVLVAEEKIGRPLKEGEVVHHINRNKSDNRPENLLVLSSSDHAKLHIDAKELGNWKEGGF